MGDRLSATHVISLGTDVRARSEDYIKSKLLGQLQKVLQICQSVPHVDPWLWIMGGPLNVGVDDVQSSSLHYFQAVSPGLSEGPEVVERPGGVLEFFAV